jgi:hypothetical protein
MSTGIEIVTFTKLTPPQRNRLSVCPVCQAVVVDTEEHTRHHYPNCGTCGHPRWEHNLEDPDPTCNHEDAQLYTPPIRCTCGV